MKTNISEQIRIIQRSYLSPSEKQLSIENLFDEYTKINQSDVLYSDFISTISKAVLTSINTYENIVQINFNLCPIDSAKKFATLIGINVFNIGKSVFLTWAQPLNKD